MQCCFTFDYFIQFMYLKHNAIDQEFSKSAFKGPNPNFHQCQMSEPEQLVITKLVFNQHTVAYITCIRNKHNFFETIKSKSGKTIN